MRSRFRAPVEFAEHGFTGLIDQPKTVDAEALHRGEAARNGPVRHGPHQHVR